MKPQCETEERVEKSEPDRPKHKKKNKVAEIQTKSMYKMVTLFDSPICLSNDRISFASFAWAPTLTTPLYILTIFICGLQLPFDANVLDRI